MQMQNPNRDNYDEYNYDVNNKYNEAFCEWQHSMFSPVPIQPIKKVNGF